MNNLETSIDGAGHSEYHTDISRQCLCSNGLYTTSDFPNYDTFLQMHILRHLIFGTQAYKLVCLLNGVGVLCSGDGAITQPCPLPRGQAALLIPCLGRAKKGSKVSACRTLAFAKTKKTQLNKRRERSLLAVLFLFIELRFGPFENANVEEACTFDLFFALRRQGISNMALAHCGLF